MSTISNVTAPTLVAPAPSVRPVEEAAPAKTARPIEGPSAGLAEYLARASADVKTIRQLPLAA